VTGQPAPEDLLARLAADFADQVVQHYRISRADAVAMILADWQRQPRLVTAAASAKSPGEVRRLRIYQDAAAATKRDVYHRLRRYLAVDTSFDDAVRALAGLAPGSLPNMIAGLVTAVAAAHVSTAERLPHLDEFVAGLTAVTGAVETVVDAGCGVLPLLFPLDSPAGTGVREYWALDKDSRAITALREYARVRADQRIRPVQWNIADGWQAAFAAGLPARCDLGLLLKVVPVVRRQAPALLQVLAAMPADRLVISGSRTAMVKRRDIERRETRELQRFCAEHALTEIGRFRTADEICLVVQRG
jgi:Ribosomal RNA methyltransferase (FmrO)